MTIVPSTPSIEESTEPINNRTRLGDGDADGGQLVPSLPVRFFVVAAGKAVAFYVVRMPTTLLVMVILHEEDLDSARNSPTDCDIRESRLGTTEFVKGAGRDERLRLALCLIANLPKA